MGDNELGGLHAGDLLSLAGGLLCVVMGVAILVGKLPPSGLERARDPARYRVVNGRLAIAVGVVLLLLQLLQLTLPHEQARIAIAAVALAGLVPLAVVIVLIIRMRKP